MKSPFKLACTALLLSAVLSLSACGHWWGCHGHPAHQGGSHRCCCQVPAH